MENTYMEKILVTSFTFDELQGLIKDSIREALSEINLAKTEADDLKLMSVTDACEYLNLERQTIYGYTAKGLIPFSKRGKRLYFSKKDLHEWVMKGRNKTQDEIEKIADEYIERKNRERAERISGRK